MIEPTYAHIDEAGARLPDGRRLYLVAATLSAPADHPQITESLTALQIGNIPLHFHAERYERRVTVAEAISAAPLFGALLLSTSTNCSEQEQARARLLRELLPRLEHVEGVQHVVLETRAGGDRHDRRTRDRLRRSRQITAQLRIDHAAKTTPLLWPADWIASAYVAAYHHDESKPWEIINAAHLVDITEIDPG